MLGEDALSPRARRPMLARAFTVESAEPGLGAARRTHAVLTARGGEGVDVVHLWTDDAELAGRLRPGARLDLVVAFEGEPSRG